MNAEERRQALANTIGEPIEDGWFKVSPYGSFRGSVPGRDQVVGDAQAKAMVSEFNSMRGKLGRLFRGIPIYIGHPDADPTTYPDQRRLGKVVELERRSDGLWAKPEWNSLGKENLDEGFWMFPSPYWDAPAGRANFEPDRLISIGLTNTPRIPTSEPVANSQDTNIMDRNTLIELLNLPAEATDEEIMAALNALITKVNEGDEAAREELEDIEALQNSLTEATTAREAAENSLSTVTGERDQLSRRADQADVDLLALRESYANTLLDAAVEDGRIEGHEREALANQFTTDFETAKTALIARKPQLNTAALNLERSRREVSDEQARREKVANAVGKLMNEDPNLSYLDAHSRVKNDPEMAKVFEEMKSPDEQN